MMNNDKEGGRIPSDLISTESQVRYGSKPWNTEGGRFDHISFTPSQLPDLYSKSNEDASRRYQEAVEKSTSLKSQS